METQSGATTKQSQVVGDEEIEMAGDVQRLPRRPRPGGPSTPAVGHLADVVTPGANQAYRILQGADRVEAMLQHVRHHHEVEPPVAQRLGQPLSRADVELDPGTR